MSDSEDSGPGQREVAHRLFGAEFDDADLSYSESDEERAPNYVVTPTGARANRVFLVGVLTELEQVNDEVLRARVVDPTGPFVVYAGQYQPKPLAFLEAATPPVFVAVTGKARTFEPDDSDRVFTSIRPESISEADADTRDRWVVQTAEQTIERIGRMASAKQSGATGDALREQLTAAGVSESDADGIALALDHYGTTGDYLSAVRDLALDAARVVAGERDEAGTLSMAPSSGTDSGLEGLGTLDLDSTGTVTADSTTDTESVADAVSETEDPVASNTATDESVSGSPVSDESTADATGSDGAAGRASADDDQTATTAEPSPPADDTAESSATVDETSLSSTATDTATEEGETLGDFAASDSSAAETSGDEQDEPSEDAESSIEDGDEFDPEFELDDNEREEIEQEYGTDFQSGTEVNEPGEADIETPDPDDIDEDTEAGIDEAPEPVGGDETDETETASASEASSTSGAETDTTAASEDVAEQTPEQAAPADSAAVEDVDLEDAVMEMMADLDSGGGADKEAVIERVVGQYDVSTEDVEAAIQDALMNGRCYEPGDGKLTPI